MLRTVLLPAFVLALAGTVPACHRPNEDDLGLPQHGAKAVVVDKLTDPRELVAALTQPGAALDDKLGARTLDVQQTTTLTLGAVTDRMEQHATLELDGKGGFHLVSDLDHPDKVGQTVQKGDSDGGPRDKVAVSAQGMEAVALAGTLYVRPRYGRFVSRRPEPGELDRLRELAETMLGDDLELLAPGLAVRDAGAGTVLGHATRKLDLSLGEGASAGSDDEARHAWRKALKIGKLGGRVEVDATTGAPLTGTLDAEYSMPREGGMLTTHIVVSLASRAASPLHAPEAVPSPHRPRPMVERNQLLEGLAPPAGTSAARHPQ